MRAWLLHSVRVAAALALALVAPRLRADDTFERQIRPVLIEHCFSCHSADADPLKGGLRLDSTEGLAKGGASGQPAVIPGDPDRSLLLKAIRHDDPDLRMPPKQALPAPVIAAFEAWIRAGAAYPASIEPIDFMAAARQHWAFHPPQPQPVPDVRDTAWPITEIDRFILSRLETEGLRPAPRADRRTLIRRLSYDLRGLPPPPAEVAAFVNDPDPRAWEALVERYLASPHYGERWARHWLDVARYADTKGYVYGDRESVVFTHSYVYRDWVVNAFNRDLPYDRFIKLQLAADSLAGEAHEDWAAMGFLTLGPRFLGVMPDIIDDRIDTVSRGLMGLTVSCARCHDHKFDPIPIEDYYSLYGVFSASSERTLPLNSAELDEDRFRAFTEELRAREAKSRDQFALRTAELEARLRAQVSRYINAVPGADQLPTDDFYEIRSAEDINPTIVRRWAAYIVRRGPDDPVFGPWNRLAPLPADRFADGVRAVLRPAAAPPRDGDVLLASAPLAAPPVNPAVLAALAAKPPASLAELAAVYATLFQDVNDRWETARKKAEDAGTPAPSGLDDPAFEALRRVMFDDGSPIRVPDGHIVDLEWMFDEPSRVELAKLNAEIDRWIAGAKDSPAFAVILADKPEPPQPRVFRRGSPANPGPEVPRQLPELLAGSTRTPFASGSGRRELAEAIASADNPLTARVMVNRIWAWHFGAGLVTTPSDFGTRAAAPSHPELLDWLARYFVDHGWSVKQLHRQILLSATYQQSSQASDPLARDRDPDNRWLARFNVLRLDFESLRDALLAASGELDTTLGGRPVEIATAPYANRRTLYGKVDRQFLPPVFRVFDFPNPDMHSPQRVGTVAPQQALFLMNNPFVHEQARTLAGRAANAQEDPAARVEWMYRRAYQRAATPEQMARALEFVQTAQATETPPQPAPPPPAWTYGYGRFDEVSRAVASFTPLPHFTGSAWQGGAAWPDPTLGWAQLTAEGGHPGNDLDHAIVRRWTAPTAGHVAISGRIRHARTEGDGIMARVVSSRHGVLGEWFLHNTEAEAAFSGITAEPGDILDFVVDIRKELNSDEFLWAPVISTDENAAQWSAKDEFAGPYETPPVPLDAWAKFAQVLLSSNEFLYVE